MRWPTPRRVRSSRLIRSLASRIGGVGIFPRHWLGICFALCRSSAPSFSLGLGGACSAVFSTVAMDALDIFPALIRFRSVVILKYLELIPVSYGPMDENSYYGSLEYLKYQSIVKCYSNS